VFAISNGIRVKPVYPNTLQCCCLTSNILDGKTKVQHAISLLPWRKNQKSVMNHGSKPGAIDEAEHFKFSHE